jgi:hypothetical protein
MNHSVTNQSKPKHKTRMKQLLHFTFAAAFVAAAGTFGSAQAQPSEGDGPPEIVVHLPNPYPGYGPLAGNLGRAGKPGGGGGKSNGINYHGGPVMVSGVNIYYIWYGNWSGNTATTTILTDFANSIGGSPYFNINTTYYNGSSTPIPNSVSYAGFTTDNYSRGATALTDADIQTIVSSALSSGALGQPDPKGVYFVLTSADVTKSGFCTSYCGWHTHGTIAGSDIKYSFVGNPAQCPSACTAQPTVSPNGDVGADGMVSIIAHELEEAATDPDLNAWYDLRGYENADKCAWTFGMTYTTPDGAQANVKLGNATLGYRDYLIQRNWVNGGGGYCAMSYP